MTERRERVRTSVLDAALDLLDEGGVQGLTFESVAARSGVAKTTIYRHWPTKAQLTIEALSIMHEPTPTPNSGDLRADLRACFVAVSEQALDDRKARIFASVLDAAQRDPEYARLHTQMTAEKLQPLRTVLELAQLRGQLRSDLDLDDVCDLVIGPVIMRVLATRRPIDEAFLDLLVETLVAGLAATARTSA